MATVVIWITDVIIETTVDCPFTLTLVEVIVEKRVEKIGGDPVLDVREISPSLSVT